MYHGLICIFNNYRSISFTSIWFLQFFYWMLTWWIENWFCGEVCSIINRMNDLSGFWKALHFFLRLILYVQVHFSSLGSGAPLARQIYTHPIMKKKFTKFSKFYDPSFLGWDTAASNPPLHKPALTLNPHSHFYVTVDLCGQSARTTRQHFYFFLIFHFRQLGINLHLITK